MEVPTPSGLFEVPTSHPVEHCGWGQVEIAEAGMASLWERVERLRSAVLCSSSIVCEFVAHRLAPLQGHSRPMWLLTGPSDPMRLSGPPLGEPTIRKVGKILMKKPDPMLLASNTLPLYRLPVVEREAIISRMPFLTGGSPCRGD